MAVSLLLCIHWRENEHSFLIQRIIQDYWKAYVSTLGQFGGFLLKQIMLALKQFKAEYFSTDSCAVIF